MLTARFSSSFTSARSLARRSLSPLSSTCPYYACNSILNSIHWLIHTYTTISKNLAPIERNDIAWSYIAATRLWDLALFIVIWRRETGGHRRRVDAPLLGAVLSSIERVPLYLLLSHFFLLGYKTLFQVFITDIFAASSAMYVISKLEPKKPSFYPSPASSETSSLFDVLKDRTKLETITYGIGLSTLINALYSYISEHAFLGQFIRDNVLENEIPAYLSSLKPALSEALANPTIAIPILRSATSPLSMPEHISHALPLSLLITTLTLVYLPQKSPLSLAGLVALLVFPSNALSVFNLLPIQMSAAVAIGAENALRAATAAYIVAWITEDWRRPYQTHGQAVGRPDVILKDVTQAGGDEIYIVEKDSVTIRRNVS